MSTHREARVVTLRKVIERICLKTGRVDKFKQVGPGVNMGPTVRINSNTFHCHDHRFFEEGFFDVMLKDCKSDHYVFTLTEEEYHHE